ncbi:MAG: hypothetical protein U0165_18260 [Polyangiaceae bacterium]
MGLGDRDDWPRHHRRAAGFEALTLVAASPLAYLALSNPFTARLVFAHAHNVIGVLVLGSAMPWSNAPLLIAPLTLLAAALVAIFSGVTLPVTESVGGLTAFHLLAQRGVELARAESFRLRGPLAHARVCVFARRSLWRVAGVGSQEDLRAQGTTSFVMSAKSVLHDLGKPGFIAVVIAAAVVLVLSTIDLHNTRNLYLSFATFHGYLEVAMLGYFAVAGRPRPYEPT